MTDSPGGGPDGSPDGSPGGDRSGDPEQEPGPEDQLFELIAAANELPPDQRRAFLTRVCGDNTALFEEALQLVEADVPTGFLEPPVVEGKDALGSSLIGETLGDFLLIDELGRGGMGVVYRARQTSLNRMVAVKVLPATKFTDPLTIERFRRESIAASKLHHGALVGIIASGVEPECAWFAMPLVDGHDLHHELAEQSIRNPAACLLPPFGTDEYRTAIAAQLARIAEGLEHAHTHGVVHRDIKPRNLLLDPHGQMLLADFGLAKVTGDATITATGALQGTPFYMSPEQARALRDPIGPLSDVYSLSVVLYELLTLKRPFEGIDLQDILKNIASGTPQRLRAQDNKIPRDLAVICEKGMAYRPADRYPTAAALAADLRRFLARESILARPLPWTRRAARWIKKHPWKTAIPAAAAAVLVTAGLVVHSERDRAFRASVLGPATLLAESTSPSQELLSAAWIALRTEGAERLDDAAAADTIARARALINADIAARIDRIDTDLLAGTGPCVDPRFGGDVELEPNPARLVDGLVLATESAALYPNHKGFAERAAVEEVLPRVSAKIAAPIQATAPARVFAQTIDDVTGTLSAPEEIGTTPLAGTPLSPGSYRFTAVLPDGRFAEIERDLAFRPTQVDITFWPRSNQEIQAKMVRVEPGVDGFPAGERPFGCLLHEKSTQLPPYWISSEVISNETFAQFLQESEALVPTGWSTAGFNLEGMQFTGNSVPRSLDLVRWRTLPAIRLSYDELRACAEWLGCRAPTHLELEFAQRGPSLARIPRGTGIGPPPADSSPTFTPNVNGSRYSGPKGNNGEYWHAVASLRPTNDASARSAPFGLFHAYGNVFQWTSTTATRMNRISPKYIEPIPNEHLCLGGSWFAASRGGDLSIHITETSRPGFISYQTSLRPARSAAPPQGVPTPLPTKAR